MINVKTGHKIYAYIYIYIYIYIVLFGPVKLEVTLQLSSPMSILFYLSIRSEEVLLYFSSGFWFTPETKNRMEINL